MAENLRETRKAKKDTSARALVENNLARVASRDNVNKAKGESSKTSGLMPKKRKSFKTHAVHKEKTLVISNSSKSKPQGPVRIGMDAMSKGLKTAGLNAAMGKGNLTGVGLRLEPPESSLMNVATPKTSLYWWAAP